MALLTAYVGMFGQAVGVRREFGGIMSKPWRMVALHLGAWTAFAFSRFTAAGDPLAGGLRVLDWTCIVVIAGCVQTIVVRLRGTMRALATKQTGSS
jgi:hypothetical protein